MPKRTFRDTTGKPQNVLEKEYLLDQKISDELLPALPSFVHGYDSFLKVEGKAVKTRLAYMQDLLAFFDYMTKDTGLSEASAPKNVSLEDMARLRASDITDYLEYVEQYPAVDQDGQPKLNPEGHQIIITNGVDARARKRSSIVGLLKYLYKNDLLETDITGKIVTISVKNENRAIKALNKEEVDELLELVTTGKIESTQEELSEHQKYYWEKTRYRDRLILILFVITGLRVSELQQLNISSFNLKRKNFTIYRKRGKESVMPMNRIITDAFNQYMELDRGRCDDVAKGSEDALFLGLTTERYGSDNEIDYGRKRLSVEQIRALVKKYTAMVIGGKGYSPHKLRATTATNALRRGHDLSQVANLLDHDSYVTTKRYVKVLDEEAKRDVIEDF